MKGKFICSLILVFVVIGFCYTFYSERESYKKQLKQLRLEKDNLYTAFSELYTVREKERTVLTYDLKGIEVVDKENNKRLLTTLPTKKKLYIYIGANMCGLCVDKTIESLERYVPVIGKENIYIIGYGYRLKYFFSGTSFKDWGTLFISSHICFPHIETETPICFYVDENNKIRYSYIKAKNVKLDFESFIDIIKQEI